MGDGAINQFPNMLAREVVAKALAGRAPLQTELFLQLMKQLTANPSAESEAAGWRLMALALQCFKPDPMVEQFLEYFLRESTGQARCRLHPTAYIRLMYETVRHGSVLDVPSDAMLQAMLLRDCSQEKPGELNKLLLADEPPDGLFREKSTPRIANPQQFSGAL